MRNIWRLYGGWWDGNPARLKPASDSAVAAEVAALADAGDLRLACQLVEWAVQAAPQDDHLHGTRARIYELRRRSEPSLMAKGIFGAAARDSSRPATP